MCLVAKKEFEKVFFNFRKIASRHGKLVQFNEFFDKYCAPCIDYVIEGKYTEGEEVMLGKRFNQIIPLTNLNMAKQRQVADRLLSAAALCIATPSRAREERHIARSRSARWEKLILKYIAICI